MKIASTQRNTNKPAFHGHIIIEMDKLGKKISPEFIDKVKIEIGEGLISMPFKYRKQIIQNDCFVGFARVTENSAVHEVVIATGHEDFWNRTGKTKAKIKQVDNLILNKVFSILTKLGFSDRYQRAFIVEYESGFTGEIIKKEKELELVLDKRDFWSIHKFKEENDKFSYDYEMQVYDDYYY